MENLKKKLKLIRNFIDNNHDINFFEMNYRNPEITCHLGDLYDYFVQSLDLLKPNYEINDYQQYHFQFIGILQTVYIQQDFIIELCRIVGIKEIIDNNRELNRDIRNELIGHPISKEKNLLKSSVYVKRVSSNSIKYLLDKPLNKTEIKTIKLEDVLDRHIKYLSENLDNLLNKINNKINCYKKKRLVNLITIYKNNKITTEEMIKVINHNLPDLKTKTDESLFDNETIKRIHLQQNEHPRYKYYIDYFIENSINVAKGYINDFYSYQAEISRLLDKKQISSLQEKYKYSYIHAIDYDIELPFDKWYIQLLQEKHDLWDIGFRGINEYFNENKIIQKELEHLRQIRSNYQEYEISMKYLEWLIYDEIKRKQGLHPKVKPL